MNKKQIEDDIEDKLISDMKGIDLNNSSLINMFNSCCNNDITDKDIVNKQCIHKLNEKLSDIYDRIIEERDRKDE